MGSKVRIAGDRFEASEPEPLFQTAGFPFYSGRVFCVPIGNGQQFVVLRSAPVLEKDNRLTIVTNVHKVLQAD
jgi:hypothetical protein